MRVVLSPEAEEVYSHLNEKASTSKIERTLLSAIKKKIGLIKANVHYGDPIRKSMIPPVYVNRYGIRNLFRVELPHYWRMLYTLTSDEVEIIAFVLDLIGHKDYDRKFGYRKK